MTDKIVVISTCRSSEEAGRIARALVGARLAACVTMFPGVTSIYRWKGALEEAAEVLLMIKSDRASFSGLKKELARLHSYDLPEILALPVVDGSEGYLNWLAGELETKEGGD